MAAMCPRKVGKTLSGAMVLSLDTFGCHNWSSGGGVAGVSSGERRGGTGQPPTTKSPGTHMSTVRRLRTSGPDPLPCRRCVSLIPAPPLASQERRPGAVLAQRTAKGNGCSKEPGDGRSSPPHLGPAFSSLSFFCLVPSLSCSALHSSSLPSKCHLWSASPIPKEVSLCDSTTGKAEFPCSAE